jgi:WD40 repeat protein
VSTPKPASMAGAVGDLKRVSTVHNETRRIVTDMNFSACGMYLAVASEDDLLRIVATGPESRAVLPAEARGTSIVATHYLEKTGVNHVRYSPFLSDQVYVTPRARSNADVFRINLERGSVTGAYHILEKGGIDASDEGEEYFSTLVHSPTSNVFAAAKENGYCSFFNPQVSQAIATLQKPCEGEVSCAFSGDGKRFAVAHKWGVLAYDWRMLMRGPIAQFEPSAVDQDGSICSVEFNPANADELLVSSTNMVLATLGLRDASSSAFVQFHSRQHEDLDSDLSVLNRQYMAYKRKLQCAPRYDPTGTVVAVGTMASSLLLLDVRNQYRLSIKAMRVHNGTVTGVAWNPRYDLLASAGIEVNLWTLMPGSSAAPGSSTMNRIIDLGGDIEV